MDLQLLRDQYQYRANACWDAARTAIVAKRKLGRSTRNRNLMILPRERNGDQMRAASFDRAGLDLCNSSLTRFIASAVLNSHSNTAVARKMFCLDSPESYVLCISGRSEWEQPSSPTCSLRSHLGPWRFGMQYLAHDDQRFRAQAASILFANANSMIFEAFVIFRLSMFNRASRLLCLYASWSQQGTLQR